MYSLLRSTTPDADGVFPVVTMPLITATPLPVQVRLGAKVPYKPPFLRTDAEEEAAYIEYETERYAKLCMARINQLTAGFDDSSWDIFNGCPHKWLETY